MSGNELFTLCVLRYIKEDQIVRTVINPIINTLSSRYDQKVVMTSKAFQINGRQRDYQFVDGRYDNQIYDQIKHFDPVLFVNNTRKMSQVKIFAGMLAEEFVSTIAERA